MFFHNLQLCRNLNYCIQITLRHICIADNCRCKKYGKLLYNTLEFIQADLLVLSNCKWDMEIDVDLQDIINNLCKLFEEICQRYQYIIRTLVLFFKKGGKELFSCNMFCHFYFTYIREKGLLFTVFREICKKINMQDIFNCLFIVKWQFYFAFFCADTPLFKNKKTLSKLIKYTCPMLKKQVLFLFLPSYP